MNLSWGKPASGEPVSYEVLALPTKTLHTAKGGATSLLVGGLEAGATYTFEVRAVTADGKSEPATTEPIQLAAVPPSRRWIVSSCVLVGLVLLAGFVALFLNWTAATRHGIVFACGVVGVGLAVLTFVGWADYGLWRGIIGADRRVSTSI